MILNIFGATGSIGTTVLKVLDDHQHTIKLNAISCKNNIHKLANIAKKYRANVAITHSRSKLDVLDELLDKSVMCSSDIAAANIFNKKFKDYVHPDILNPLPVKFSNNSDIKDDDVYSIVAVNGVFALRCVIEALRFSDKVLIASKESIVYGWHLIDPERVIPLDSEHSALYELLANVGNRKVKNVAITASGGVLTDRDINTFKDISVSDVLSHPVWSMGDHITVGSSLMSNKGLEIIEACRLFNLRESDIDVFIHKSAIVHGMVSFKDGTTICECYKPSMAIPIARALGMQDAVYESMDFENLQLSFTTPSKDRFPMIFLAREAINTGQAAVIAYASACDIAINACLKSMISFTDIYSIVYAALEKYKDYDLTPYGMHEIYSFDIKIKTMCMEYIDALKSA